MTRIISGRLRGRTLAAAAAGTRPTTDRVREALFSAIDSRVDLAGAAVLDLFAGSGALGLEAVSRGADTAWFVESGGRAVTGLRRNVGALVSEIPSVRTTIRRAALPGALSGPCPVDGGFDLVVADPPYEKSAGFDTSVLEALHTGGWVREESLVVWERSTRDPAVGWPPTYDVVFTRAYGETTIEMARPASSSSPSETPVDTVGS
ncbi:MAG TPA: 16S rRNA (guanine(966)-N(2))-methyltransferase RsmD [Candidatus Dietzia intestinipullorum]|nr:16S rRNA (guanine(966)-N(2))-methyltransferase RsmD [Candidatus Dietzia intestinipullorum]